MRVIAGKARRIQLKTIEGLETRPTTDQTPQRPICTFSLSSLSQRRMIKRINWQAITVIITVIIVVI